MHEVISERVQSNLSKGRRGKDCTCSEHIQFIVKEPPFLPTIWAIML